MWAETNVAGVLSDLKVRLGAIAAALLARNGQTIRADLPAGTFAETFAIMCATMLGAAAASTAELHRGRPTRLVIHGADSTTVIVECGSEAFLVAVLEQAADPSRVLSTVEQFALLLVANATAKQPRPGSP